MNRNVVRAALLAVLLGSAAAMLRAAATIDAVAASVTRVAGSATVLFTAKITEPSVIPAGINLLKTDAAGKTLSVVGVMNDDGLLGDAVRGDKIFSRQVEVSETVLGSIYFRVSAPFKGVILRTLSPLIPIQIDAPDQPVNIAPTVGAGADQTTTLPGGVTLAGSVTDDGLPSGAAVTHVWTQASGPGTTHFANANGLGTTATFSVAGTYVLRLTATDTLLSAFDDVSVTVNPAPPTNQAPQVTAATSTPSVTLPNAVASLSGTVTDDGLPTTTLTRAWTKVSGPGTVTFADASTPTTTATFDTVGSYVLRLTGTDGALSAFADVSVTVNPAPPTNQAPQVTATTSTPTVTLPNAVASLSGTVTDDGLPSSTLTRAWTKVSGPGTVTFADPSAPTTTATFDTVGSYVLRLTGSDGALSAFA
ncbi:MAG: hypothetical protein ABL961_17905, partial [Vicinamibacterales bacterium]